jgi:hypothetical protein
MARHEVLSKEIAAEQLMNYLLDKGFEYKRRWYFRTTWMNKTLLTFLEKNKTVKRLGNTGYIAKRGVEFPNRPEYQNPARQALIYRVNDNGLNSMLSFSL